MKLQLFPSMQKSPKTKADETMFNHLYVHSKGKIFRIKQKQDHFPKNSRREIHFIIYIFQ